MEIVARDAQQLVAAVDRAHILDGDGNVKPEWRQRLGEYLAQASAEMVRRKATALILGCTHFEYFERDFARLLPTLSARNGIISPSGALACRLLDAYDEYLDENPVRPIARREPELLRLLRRPPAGRDLQCPGTDPGRHRQELVEQESERLPCRLTM